MSKIAVIGIIGESVFLTVDKHQAVGETAHATSIHRELGGKGYNQAVAAARFGAEVSFLTAIDAADVPTVTKAAEVDKIKLTLAAKSIPSAYGVIVTDKEGDNRVTVFGGATLDAYDVEPFRPEIEGCDILLINNEVPEEVNVAAVKIAKACGKRVILNPAPVRDICEYLLANVDIFTPNEHEASAISGIDNMIVTLGGDGCLIKWLGITVPAFEVSEVVDTTGAGDTFNGTLAVALAGGADILSACRTASAASSIEVTRKYVMPAIPTRDETLRVMSDT